MTRRRCPDDIVVNKDATRAYTHDRTAPNTARNRRYDRSKRGTRRPSRSRGFRLIQFDRRVRFYGAYGRVPLDSTNKLYTRSVYVIVVTTAYGYSI